MNNFENFFNMSPAGDMNYVTDINKMMTDMNYQNMPTQMPYKSTSSSTASSLTNPDIGFKRGNMFNNQYEEYKGYMPASLNPTGAQEKELNTLRELKFALVDLDLYLDTHPNDNETINIYNTYLNEEKRLCSEYERKYGPLTLDSPYLLNRTWLWSEGKWPWEARI